MGTEDELRERVRLAVRKVRYVVGQRRQPSTAVIVDTAFDSLGIPMSVLAWITANPEAAKGLASGEMVAVPKEPTPVMLHGAMFLKVAREDRRYSDMPPSLDTEIMGTVTAGRVYQAMIAAASPPTPSGKAQGETP